MPIIRYIPKKKEVIDNRTEDGGYYEASCLFCSGLFYPKRSNGKYCSRSCLVSAYRQNLNVLKDGGTIIKEPKIKKEDKPLGSGFNGIFNTQDEVVQFLKSNSPDVKGMVLELRADIKIMENGDSLKFESHAEKEILVRKISARKFHVLMKQ